MPDEDDPTAALHDGLEHLSRSEIGAGTAAAQAAAHRREASARQETAVARAAEGQARVDQADQLTRAAVKVAPGLPDTSRVAPGLTTEALAAFHPTLPDPSRAVVAGLG
jgi:hypothetical protein